MLSSKPTLLGFLALFVLFEHSAQSKDIQVIFPKCINTSADPCNSFIIDITQGKFAINGLSIPDHTYMYVMASTFDQQRKIFENEAVIFIYNIIEKSIKTDTCKITVLDAKRYRSGKFIAVTPDGYSETILSINTELSFKDKIIDFSNCEKDEISITSDGHN